MNILIGAALITYSMVATLPLPPAQYDHEPTVSYTVERADPMIVSIMCAYQQRGRKVLGCAREFDNYIIIRNDLTDDAFKRVLRHEKGHVNGWPGHHPRR